MLCIVTRRSLLIRGMVACHVDHVVYLGKHPLVTCLVDPQGGWSLQINSSHPTLLPAGHPSRIVSKVQHPLPVQNATSESAWVACERKHLGRALKGAVLNEGGAGDSARLAPRMGADLSIAALLPVALKVDLDIGCERVVVCWRGAHVVEGHQVCSQITQPLQQSGLCPHEHLREHLDLLSTLQAIC